MSTATDELATAVRQLRPSSPTVATHTIAVRLAPAITDAVAELLTTETVIDDDPESTTVPGMNQPFTPRPNRETRRAQARQARRAK